ncbi:MAG: FxsA family protein [Halobacteriovoraceae bacterium]|jgi:UPF0716 protein FxsA|nr:FxsA family protein [Halobacteriovoraceae bacterium]
MFGLLVILFTVVPAIEIYLLFKIGAQIGGGNTFLIIIVTGILGASLAKSQGLSILNKIQNDVNKGALPGNHIIQGLMVFAGGLLLLTPGFMTDIIGFALVLPGTRHLLLVWVKKMIERAMKSGNLNFQNFGRGGVYTCSSTTESSFNPGDSLFGARSENTSAKTKKVDGDNIIEAEFTEHD